VTKLELADNPEFRIALRTDEGRIATHLVSIFNSKSDEEEVLRLDGDSAQNFLDVVQEVGNSILPSLVSIDRISQTLDRGFMMAQEHNRMALRIIRKLSERCDRLPSSLFIVGVTGRDEHPSFGGGFGDIYRASYRGQRVALKRMRYFIRGSDLRRIRLVGGSLQTVHYHDLISTEILSRSSFMEGSATCAHLTLLGNR
jgi:hypothetical protein